MSGRRLQWNDIFSLNLLVKFIQFEDNIAVTFVTAPGFKPSFIKIILRKRYCKSEFRKGISNNSVNVKHFVQGLKCLYMNL